MSSSTTPSTRAGRAVLRRAKFYEWTRQVITATKPEGISRDDWRTVLIFLVAYTAHFGNYGVDMRATPESAAEMLSGVVTPEQARECLAFAAASGFLCFTPGNRYDADRYDVVDFWTVANVSA